MNGENLEFLQESLKYLGFGEKLPLNEQLEQQIVKETKEFQLYTESFYDDDYKLEIVLHFRRGDQKDLYFFNKYEALLRKGEAPEMDRMQTFYISKGTGVTLKEAYNLLQGRAVNKNLTNIEGEKYNAWLQLNFEEMDLNHNYKVKQFRSQYGYDLEKVLEKYPIRELKTEESKELLIKALRRGNLQPVHFLKANKAEKMFIEASPQWKSINIYSSPAMALQKLVRRPDRIVKEAVPAKSDGLENGEWKEEGTAAIDEESEEGIETVSKPASAKKGSRK
ncbi:MAG TPA: hypothetical protein VF939_06750 [Puia sp.]